MAGIKSSMVKGFVRYAIAPASLARSTKSFCENAVKMTTGAIRCLAILSAALMPSSLGIFTSITTKSGFSLSVNSIAASPSPAWPTTL